MIQQATLGINGWLDQVFLEVFSIHSDSVFRAPPATVQVTSSCRLFSSALLQHGSMAKHINPWMFLVRNIIRKEVQRTRKKRPILTILSFFKNYFDLAGNFCCHLLAHVYLWPVRGCSLKGELQTGCVSISMEEQEDLHHCVLCLPAFCVHNPSPEPSALLVCRHTTSQPSLFHPLAAPCPQLGFFFLWS